MQATFYANPGADAQVPSRNVDQEINDRLEQWHRWSAGYRYAGGYSAICASCPTLAGRDAEDDIDVDGCEALDAVIDAMRHEHRLALRVLARNLASNAQVWTSARLPVDAEERAVLTMEARNDLARRMLVRGLL